MRPYINTPKERILRGVYIDYPNRCWRWLGHINIYGYGMIWGGREAKGAHRVAYEQFIGPIQPNMEVDHICFVRDCCNPEHLQLLTKEQNSGRKKSLLRDTCPRGHLLVRSSTGKRVCRACNVISAKRSTLKKRAAARAAAETA